MNKCLLVWAFGLGVVGVCFGARQPVERVLEPPRPQPTVELPGARPDGSVLLPNQWSLRPAGKQILLGDFPVNIAVHPAGKYAAVLHCGYGVHEVIVVDLAANRVVSRVPIEESFYGLAFTADGSRLFCSGAGREVIHAFGFKDGYLGEHSLIPLRDAKLRGVPAGLAVSSDAKSLYVANVLGHRISYVDLVGRTNRGDLLLGTNTAAQTVTATRPAADEDEAAVTKRAEAALDSARASDPFPYGCVLDEKRQRLYVSLWAQAAVAVIDLKSQEITRWATEEHPNEMLLSTSGKLLFVANANRNTVTVLDTATGRPVETLLAEFDPYSPPGSTPNSLALSPDQSLLFVANATINAVAVFDVSAPGHSRSLGFIPVGWYPTSVRVTPDGKRLLVANGKGAISRANRHGPMSGREPPTLVREYIAGLMTGTLSVIDLPLRPRFEEQMKAYTALAYRGRPSNLESQWDAAQLANNPVPRKLGDPSPIQYVIYVIKENRTYDQVLGDMPEGNGDSALCLFPELITPNHHQIAREFVLLDNFYVDGEVSADGHEWTMGAYATDFVEKIWPLSYGHNQAKKYAYPSEGTFPIAAPAGGYLWDRAKEAGVSYRSYGEFVANSKTPRQPGTARVATLRGHIDPWFRSFDVNYSDQLRADRFISELRRFEQEGGMPRLQVVRLPNDHTAGVAAGKLTPTSMVADNDLAFGRIVEAVTHSKFWPETAIFVVEDDAQNGSDHVDAHRSIAFVASPYVKRGTVDSTLYSSTSMLRTMELILGLKPMSQFDAAARPMFNAFQAKREMRCYTALPSRVSLTDRNTRLAWGSQQADRMDFTKEDAADDLLLNEMIWRSVRGTNSPMPAPRRAAFFLAHTKTDDDD